MSVPVRRGGSVYASLNNIPIKYWAETSSQGFLMNSLRLSLHASVAFAHVQMIYFDTQSDFSNQFLYVSNDFLVSLVKDSLLHWGFLKSPSKKKFIDDVIFILMISSKSQWPANFTLIFWASQSLHRSSSFDDGYCWSRFQLHDLSATSDTWGEACKSFLY